MVFLGLLFVACKESTITNTVIFPESDTSTSSTDSGQDGQQNLDDINIDRALEHLAALQEIAFNHGGNRAAGTTGYDASVAYVVEVLEEANYTVTQWPFSFSQYQILGDPELSVGSELIQEISVLYYSPGGTVEAPLAPVNLMIPPGNQPNASNSGCSSSDFLGFPSGSIALIQRGSCTFREKVEFAQDAGASAVIIFNEGQSGREDVLEGTLGEPQGLSIPVMGASYAVGAFLAQREGDVVTLSIDAVTGEVESVNVFAERSVRDPSARIVVGAHLDSVFRGPGINDNGSGVASQLVLAEELSAEGHVPAQRIQFAFWGAEELGLIGSSRYVSSLSDSERREILANLNFDMVASPNFARFIYDGDGSSFGTPGPNGSDLIEAEFQTFFEQQNLPYEATAFDGRSDYGPFIMAGIPAGGLFTGAEGIKDAGQSIYGGNVGEPFDACYHLECDSEDNINVTALKEMMAAIFQVTRWAAESDDLRSGKSTKSGRQIELNKKGCHDIR